MVHEQPPLYQHRALNGSISLAVFAGVLCALAATWLLAVCCKQVQALQTVRKAMTDLQARFAAAVATQVGGAEVTKSAFSHAMLADEKHYYSACKVSVPPHG